MFYFKFVFNAKVLLELSPVNCWMKKLNFKYHKFCTLNSVLTGALVS